VEQDRDRVAVENGSLMTRLDALTNILTTQENYLTQVGYDPAHLWLMENQSV